jgi:3-aminobutyryl-CoA ammonia-lyase
MIYHWHGFCNIIFSLILRLISIQKICKFFKKGEIKMAEEKITSTLRLRMSAKDAHYGGELVDGAHMVHLFGDVATELLIKLDGDEGLFCAYDNVEFLAPTYAGDYIEAYGEIDRIGNTSRHMVFEARKVIVSRKDINASAADFLEEPIVVARASGTCVTPKEMKRK